MSKFDYSKSVAKHELGHWFLAKEFGFNEDYIKIKVITYHGPLRFYHEAYAKSFPKGDLPNIDSVYKFLTNRISCLQAGVISEFYNAENGEVDIGSVEKAFKITAQNDIKQIEELLTIARGIKFSGIITEEDELVQKQIIIDECWDVALTIIKQNFKLIDLISDQMAERIVCEDSQTAKFTKQDLISFMQQN